MEITDKFGLNIGTRVPHKKIQRMPGRKKSRSKDNWPRHNQPDPPAVNNICGRSGITQARPRGPQTGSSRDSYGHWIQASNSLSMSSLLFDRLWSFEVVCMTPRRHIYHLLGTPKPTDNEVMRNRKHKVILEFVTIKPYSINPTMKMQ